MQAQLNREKQTIAELKQVYAQAAKDVEKRIRELSMRTDMENLQTIIYQKQYQEVLKKQIDNVLDSLHTQEFTTIESFLTNCYTDGYIGVMYDIAGQGIPIIMPIDPKQVVKALQTDSKISTKLYTRLGEDVKKLKASIRAELSRGITQGASYNQIAVKIAKGMKSDYNTAYNSAVRIARTEGHRIQCQSAYDAQKAAVSKGADVVKQWNSVLDGRTRPHHRQLDGQIRELDEPFEISGMKADYPGAFGRASEDCNCRCALLQRARWALDDDELETLKERAEFYDLDKTKDFEDFQKKYLKASEQVHEEQQKIPDFVPAKSIAEAEEFVSQFVDLNIWGGTGVSYKGISVESANAVNEALYELYSTYDMNKLGGVYVAKGNTKLGKAIQDATAAYSPVRQSLLLNNSALKDLESVKKAKEDELRLLGIYKNNPKGLVFKTKRAEDVVKASMLSGRSTVPDNIKDVINHEMGHSIERAVSKSGSYAKIKANMNKYAEKISGYATFNEAEYIAESFASYRKGEKIIDPELEKVFESFKITSKGIEKTSKTAKIKAQPLGYFSTKNIKTVHLPKDEYAHVKSEINTHMSDEQRKMPVVSKAIGNYVYTFENYGFDDYRIIGKVPIEGDKYDEIERIFDEIE